MNEERDPNPDGQLSEVGKKDSYFLSGFQMALHLGLPPPPLWQRPGGTPYQSAEEAGGYQFTRREEAQEEERRQTNY